VLFFSGFWHKKGVWYQRAWLFLLPVPPTLCVPYRYHRIYTLYWNHGRFTTCTGAAHCLQPVPVPFNIHIPLPIPCPYFSLFFIIEILVPGSSDILVTGTVQCLQPVPVPFSVYSWGRYSSMLITCTGTVQYAFSFTNTRYCLIFTTR